MTRSELATLAVRALFWASIVTLVLIFSTGSSPEFIYQGF
jgi:hypothetical protein